MKEKNYTFDKITFPQITASAQSQNITAGTNTDVINEEVIGIAVSLSDEDAIPNSRIELKIDSKEILPVGFEAKLLTSGINVDPNKRYYMFNKPIMINQSKIEGKFTDGENFTAAYYVFITLLSIPKTDRTQ